MSAVQRLPMMAGTLSVGATLAAIIGVPSLRNRFAHLIGTGKTGNMLRLIVVAFALLNLKNLPFVWHVSFCPSAKISLGIQWKKTTRADQDALIHSGESSKA